MTPSTHHHKHNFLIVRPELIKAFAAQNTHEAPKPCATLANPNDHNQNDPLDHFAGAGKVITVQHSIPQLYHFASAGKMVQLSIFRGNDQ
jgi:hypothetical protein